MGLDVSIWAAFAAGVLSFLSPCVLPLVPPYLCYLAGVNLEELTGADAQQKRASSRKALLAAFVFVLGFSTIFVALGAGASAIGQLLREYLDILAKIAGVVIIIMGLHFLGVFKIRFLLMEKRYQASTSSATLIGAYVIGLAFALGWTPCIGPVLASILAIAASEESVARGAGLLAVYSAGLGIPFLLAAFAINGFLAFMKRFRKHLGTVEKIMGAFLVLTGIMFLTGTMQTVSSWLLETFPFLASIG